MKRCCRASGDGHFGWCVKVGGVGMHPREFRQLEALTRPEPAPEPELYRWTPYVPPVRDEDRPREVQVRRTKFQGVRPGRELRKEWRELAAAAVEQGWAYVPGPHPKLYSPDGESMVPFPKTASDWRALRNTIGELRRRGVAV